MFYYLSVFLLCLTQTHIVKTFWLVLVFAIRKLCFSFNNTSWKVRDSSISIFFFWSVVDLQCFKCVAISLIPHFGSSQIFASLSHDKINIMYMYSYVLELLFC